MAVKKTQEHVPTPISELSYARMGEVIELPGWTEGKPFFARVRRVALSSMIRGGKIPNPLIAAAQKLYEGNRSKANATFEETAKVMLMIVEEALAEPSAQQLADAEVALTEQQLSAIYLYATSGPRALEQFRAQSAGGDAHPSVDADESEAERAAGA